MSEDIAALKRETLKAIASADGTALETLRIAELGRQGRVTRLMHGLGRLPEDERRSRGAELNHLKDEVTAAIAARREALATQALEANLAAQRVDVTLPPRPEPLGTIHPISRTLEEVVAIFDAMGFQVAVGPEIEEDWRNFSALNIPEHHPARQDMDTFYLPALGPGRRRVLRTHTSPGQIRAMTSGPPPYRVIVPGRTYRADHDATHSPMFHQCEGLAIDRHITLGHLKSCLIEFLRTFFGEPSLPVRFRASYFPFTEPSMEVDIGWNRASGEIGQGGDWLEILGSGMVHAAVLANCGVDPRAWQGFAFGVGIERLTMLKNGITDLRPFFESDIRWLRRYGSSPLEPAILHEGLAR